MERTSMDIKEEIVIIWFLRSKCKKKNNNNNNRSLYSETELVLNLRSGKEA